MTTVSVDGSVRAFLDALAAPTSAPGGGSAAALAGAVGVSVLEMVAGIHGRRQGAAPSGPWPALRQDLTTLAEEDARAFGAVVQAMRSTGADRGEVVAGTLKHAIEVPLAVCGACQRALEAAGPLAEACTSTVAVDLVTGAELLGAAFRAARVLVLVNLQGLGDATFAETVRDELEHGRIRAEAGQDRILQAVRLTLG